MQPGGWQRPRNDFMMDRQEMLWDVGVRVGGVVRERGGPLPSVPRGDEGMGAMCGGAFNLEAVPLVDSAGGWMGGGAARRG